MKETLYTRHQDTVEPMMVKNARNAALHTDAGDKVVNCHERNVVLDGRPLPISSSEKELTRKERSTLALNVNSKLAFHKVAYFHQHLHCRHTTIQSTGSGHGLRRWHHHHIYTHTSTSAAKKYIQPYLHKDFVWTKQNNHTLNPDKTTCTLFTPDPAEYKSNLDLKI